VTSRIIAGHDVERRARRVRPAASSLVSTNRTPKPNSSRRYNVSAFTVIQPSIGRSIEGLSGYPFDAVLVRIQGFWFSKQLLCHIDNVLSQERA
jgi:hypothetical protein